MWKVAIVGAGYWARNHLLAWQANPKVAVTALCDVDPARLAGRGEEFGIAPEARFGDLDAMLGRVEVDIVTPPKTHVPLVSAAARAGKHTMCIKPFAESIAEAREMAEVVERYGVKAMVSADPPVETRARRRSRRQTLLREVQLARVRHASDDRRSENGTTLPADHAAATLL